MERYYENRKSGHHKFYKTVGPARRKVNEKFVYVIDTWRGSIGTKGKWLVYDYPDKKTAMLGVEGIHQKRLSHGYIELRDGESWGQVMGVDEEMGQMCLF